MTNKYYKMDYKYQKCIVCFVDILGFSNIIKKTEIGKDGAQGVLNDVCMALELMKMFDDLKAKGLFVDGTQITQFSDSIVISFPWKDNDVTILNAFYALKYMQISMIMHYKLLLRGGIVIGDIIHTKDLLVGPAMISAYQLETKCAFSPRILLDSEVVDKYNLIIKQEMENKNWENDLIHKDFDDTSYIDYFNYYEDLFDNKNESLIYFEKLCGMVASHVESSDMSIRVKYLWMRNKIKNSIYYQDNEYKAIYEKFEPNKK